MIVDIQNYHYYFTGFFIFIVVLDGSDCDPLTPAENLKRFYDCGHEHPTQFTSSSDYKKGIKVELKDDSWIVYVKNKDKFKKTPGSTGSFISNRHIITSSQTVLLFEDYTLKWAINNSLEFKQNCIGNNSYHEISKPDVIDNIEVVTSGNRILHVKRAALLWMCPPPDDYHIMFVPMLLELEETVDVKYPCVSGKNTIVNGIKASTYGWEQYEKNNEKSLKLRRVANTKELSKGNDNRWILVPKYVAPYDRGGPLVADIDNKTTLIGIGGNPAHDDSSADTYFYNIHFDKFLANIWEFAGVCEVDTSMTIPIPSSSSTLPTTAGTVGTTTHPDPTFEPLEHHNKTVPKEEKMEDEHVGEVFDLVDDLLVNKKFFKRRSVKKASACLIINWIFLVFFFSFALLD